jgi:hypothetical protein
MDSPFKTSASRFVKKCLPIAFQLTGFRRLYKFLALLKTDLHQTVFFLNLQILVRGKKYI